MHDYPTLHTMVKDATKTSPHEVRHLVVVPVDGSEVTVLMQLVSGTQTEIATGTEYEMGQKADAVMQGWAGEGFRFQREREPAYEDLKSAVTLAMLMGYKVVYDAAYADVRRMNLTGAVSFFRRPRTVAIWAWEEPRVHSEPCLSIIDCLCRLIFPCDSRSLIWAFDSASKM